MAITPANSPATRKAIASFTRTFIESSLRDKKQANHTENSNNYRVTGVPVSELSFRERLVGMLKYYHRQAA
jgi:hypothetical protein